MSCTQWVGAENCQTCYDADTARILLWCCQGYDNGIMFAWCCFWWDILRSSSSAAKLTSRSGWIELMQSALTSAEASVLLQYLRMNTFCSTWTHRLSISTDLACWNHWVVTILHSRPAHRDQQTASNCLVKPSDSDVQRRWAPAKRLSHPKVNHLEIRTM